MLAHDFRHGTSGREQHGIEKTLAAAYRERGGGSGGHRDDCHACAIEWAADQRDSGAEAGNTRCVGAKAGVGTV